MEKFWEKLNRRIYYSYVYQVIAYYFIGYSIQSKLDYVIEKKQNMVLPNIKINLMLI